jgi:iron(III) transport system substrate-binding protein
VNAGRLDTGVIYADYWYRDRAAPQAPGMLSGATTLHFVTNQDPGAFVSVSGGAVLKSSRKKAAAQRFLLFVTSTRGQQVVRESGVMEYPIVPGVAADPALPPLASLQAPVVDPDRLDSDQVTRLMADAGLLS